jgi:hypothetical protein
LPLGAEVLRVADEVELSEDEEVDVGLLDDFEEVPELDDAEDAEVEVIEPVEDPETDEAVALPVEVAPRAVAVPVAPWTKSCGEKL